MKLQDKGPRFEKDPKTGVPVLVGKDTDLVEIAKTCLETVAMDQYDGDDPQFAGKTRLEASVLSLARAATESPQARTEFLNRIIGCPTQKVEAKNTNVTLVGFLDMIAREENIVEAEVIPDEEFLN